MPPSTADSHNIMQTLIDGEYGLVQISTSIVQEANVTVDVLAPFNHARPLGLAPGYSSSGELLALAISDNKTCKIIEFTTRPKRNKAAPEITPDSPAGQARKLLEQSILCRSAGELFTFDLGPLAMALFINLNTHIINAVDIQTALEGDKDRSPLSAIKSIVGDSVRIMEQNITDLFRDPVYDPTDRHRAAGPTMRAWAAQFLATFANGAETLDKVPRVDTTKLGPQELAMLAKIANDALRLDQLKPTEQVHRARSTFDPTSGSVRAESAVFKNKIRSNNQIISAETTGLRGTFKVQGRVADVAGKSAWLKTDERYTMEDKLITTITSKGRDAPTRSETQKSLIILHVLQGRYKLESDNPWVQNIWHPSEDGVMVWPPARPESGTRLTSNPPSAPAVSPDGNLARHKLNPSQQKVVDAMLSPSDEHRVVLAQGPPGTGKTSVIASFVLDAIQAGKRGIWLVAQSNVAVKNIAEKLVKEGFMDWRLLVSKDFIFEWHEHLYHNLQTHVIRSDGFASITRNQLQGCKVILCTLSMLTSFFISKFTFTVPLIHLLVDEASQIEIGDYIPVFHKFNQTLCKVCFIGDDKQLPPFGQEDLGNLQSIFEVTHLRSIAFFLNTQYRMPPQIGSFISEAVYDSLLFSNPLHPVQDDTIACYFVDIGEGIEKMSENSFKNLEECNAVLILADVLQERQKSYKIITPYDAQRNHIETEMQDIEGLAWENTCFNVDSFQGNEEDYIIISLVRSREIGFLKNLRRTNVMLTRCKKGMFVVSSKQFLAGKGKDTLVGQLAAHVSSEAWLNIQDLEDENFLKDL